MKRIVNAKIITPLRILEGYELAYDGNKIVEIGNNIEGCDETFDAKGLYCTPGFIDLHVHGGNGYDFNAADYETIKKAAYCHALNGATSCLPTVMLKTGTISEEQFNTIRSIDSAINKTKSGPEMLGIHLEGPFITDTQQEYTSVDMELCRRVVEEVPNLKIMTLAPEIGNALECTEYLNKNNIYISLGHCVNPSYSQFMECVEAGANQATHLYSSTNTVYKDNGSRLAGMTEAALMSPDVYSEIIGDGVHLTGPMMEFVFHNIGCEKFMLVTDCHARTIDKKDEPLVVSSWNGKRIAVHTYAPMDYVVKTVHEMTTISLVDIVRMATINPARAIGVDRRKGKLAKGYDADILVFDESINTKLIIARGEIIKNNL